MAARARETTLFARVRDAAGNESCSLPRLDNSISKVEKRIASKGPANKTDVELLVGLLVVKATKIEAQVLSKPTTGVLARKALQAALKLERDLASLADKEGRPL